MLAGPTPPAVHDVTAAEAAVTAKRRLRAVRPPRCLPTRTLRWLLLEATPLVRLPATVVDTAAVKKRVPAGPHLRQGCRCQFRPPLRQPEKKTQGVSRGIIGAVAAAVVGPRRQVPETELLLLLLLPVLVRTHSTAIGAGATAVAAKSRPRRELRPLT